MMTLIQDEKIQAGNFMFSLISGTKDRICPLVELTPDNVAKVEAMIQNDSDYIKSSDPNAEPDEKQKYNGSTAYWMKQLKSYLNEGSKFKVEEGVLKKVISGAVEAVDRENSTHLNADGRGREEISGRIVNLIKDDDGESFLNYLRNPENLDLIMLIGKKTTPNDPKYKPRVNLSFASKFCHYACFFLFDGEEQDNYSIYDKILCRAIPEYLKFYKIEKDFQGKEYQLDLQKTIQNIKKGKNKANDQINEDEQIIEAVKGTYFQYMEAITRIIEKSGEKISRNGFDHLLWYYFKGRFWKF